jgi:hypothetical protein
MNMEKNYKLIFDNVRELVNEWDPCSLIDSGAPNDEYDALTNKFLSGLINKTNSELIKDEIIDLLGNYYGMPIIEEIDEENKNKFNSEVEKMIEKIKNTNANNV